MITRRSLMGWLGALAGGAAATTAVATAAKSEALDAGMFQNFPGFLHEKLGAHTYTYSALPGAGIIAGSLLGTRDEAGLWRLWRMGEDRQWHKVEGY